MSGGDGGADWAMKVFGDANQQQAASNVNNTIAMKLPSECGGSVQPAMATNSIASAAAPMTGGAPKDLIQQQLHNKLQQMQQDGGFMQQLQNLATMMGKSKLSNEEIKEAATMAGGSGVLENIAVPAVLLYLNQRMGKKQTQSNKPKSMKLRKSSRFSRRYRK
jgi:hypothetical protein